MVEGIVQRQTARSLSSSHQEASPPQEGSVSGDLIFPHTLDPSRMSPCCLFVRLPEANRQGKMSPRRTLTGERELKRGMRADAG